MCRSMAGTGLARAVSDSHGSGGSSQGGARGSREAVCGLHEAAANIHMHVHAETKMCTCSLTLSHSFWAVDTTVRKMMGSGEQSGLLAGQDLSC